MEAYIADWLNLLLRWLHLITGVAWIGASFYFVWLDNHLEAPKDSRDDEKGVSGLRGRNFRNACTGSSGRHIRPGYRAWRCWRWSTGTAQRST